MKNTANSLLNQALELSALERADIAEKLLISLEHPDPDIDTIWAAEVDARIEAYEKGEIKPIPAEEVFKKYNRS